MHAILNNDDWTSIESNTWRNEEGKEKVSIVLMAQKVNRNKELHVPDKIVSSMTTRRLTRKNLLNTNDKADDSCMPQITVIIMDLQTKEVDYWKHFSKLEIY